MEANCIDCVTNQWELASLIYHDNITALDIFTDHGVLPTDVNCGKCGKPAKLVCGPDDRLMWRCYGKYRPSPKRKPVKCNFKSSHFKGTFLHNAKLEEWQVLGFIAVWLDKRFKHSYATTNLNISYNASVDWRSMCSEVTQFWLNNQDQIGGNNIVVEIDETLIVRRKHGVGRILQQVWLFGGIERVTKKWFIVPLLGDINTNVSEKRSKDILIPYIVKYIRPGSVVYSDQWKAYQSLIDYGYIHGTVNHKVNFVHPSDPECHTQNIERMWRDVKEYLKRPGMRRAYLRQYLSRYLFVKTYGEGSFHQFLIQASRLYPPQGDIVPNIIKAPEDESDDDSEDE